MPIIFTEETTTGKLVFEFSDKWQVCKYDELPFYNTIKMKGVKAVDFLATSKKSMVLMEVKYVTATNEQSSLRLTENEKKTVVIHSICPYIIERPYLVDEVVKKVKDTLLGLFSAYRQNNEDLEKHSRSLFCNPDKPILVLLFLERSEELNKEENFKPLASNLELAIKQKLSFLGNVHVNVVNSLTLPSELSIKILENEAKI
jgi:hypothetical protein